MTITRRDFLFISGLSSFPFIRKRKKEKKIRFIPKKETGTSSYDAWVELDLENMAWNLEQIKKRTNAAVMAVIKANAYGHGLKEIAQSLTKRGTADLMVGKLQEALELRSSSIDCALLNFGPYGHEETEEIIRNNISQSVFTDEIESLHRAALSLEKKAKVHIHIDTGMGRAGISYYRALPFIEKVSSLGGLEIAGISTTLTEDPDFDQEQMKRFLTICRAARTKGIVLRKRHAASSSGILALSSSHLDMVRPGITLYGYYPSEETQKKDSLSLKPVLQLKTRVFVVKNLRPGDSVSYHRAFVAKKREKIALLAVGYSDGYPFQAIDKATVLIREKRYPLIGSITANHMEVLLDKNAEVNSGDEAVLIGTHGKENITADEVAGWAGVSTYKILLGLNPLLPKRTVHSIN